MAQSLPIQNLRGSGGASINTALEPNGFARYVEVGKPIYLGGLFLGVLSSNPNVIRSMRTKRMEFKLLTDISGRRFGRILTKGAAINNTPRLLAEYNASLEVFLSAFRGELKHGDHLIIAPNEQRGTAIILNSVLIAEIAEPEFFDLLLNMWIGNIPPTRDFKLNVLGLENRLALLQDFEYLQPLPNRRDVVAAWFEEANYPRTTLSETFVPATNEELSAEGKPQPLSVQAKQTSEQFYMNRLLLHSQQYMEYPELSRRMRHEGKVVVSVTIDRAGKLLAYAIIENCRYRLLNDAAAEGIRKAEPFPAIPDSMQGSTFTFSVPVEFKKS